MVDPDGEFISSKGLVILLEDKKIFGKEQINGLSMLDLSLIYKNYILHGTVTTISCLTCEGNGCIFLGSGDDVNVEQWVRGKLTQVGLF